MTIEPKTYASEAGHFYWPDGRPAHTQPNKSKPGEMRPTTLRDARKLGLYPSVSGILKIQAQPGLAYWVKEQVAKAAWALNFDSPMELFIEEALKAAEENMSQARDLGSEIHGAIEQYMRCLTNGFDFLQHPGHPDFNLGHSQFIKSAVDALKELGVWGQPLAAERSFASPLGYGGTVDFLTDDVLADFKCVDSLEKRLDYTDRCAQLCAYSMGAGCPTLDRRLCNIFISTSEPGKYLIREWDAEEKQRGWMLFRACQNLWEIANNYFPVRSW